MNLIVAVDKNWAIGYQNHLLVKIPNDQKWFQKVTTGRVVVMGRKTMETFPNGMPLKNRINVVLTGNKELKTKDAYFVYSVDELVEYLKQYDDEDIFVIGGESVYRQLLPYCHKAYITKIDYTYQADTFFPNLDKDPEWRLVEESDEQTYFDLCYTFAKYERN